MNEPGYPVKMLHEFLDFSERLYHHIFSHCVCELFIWLQVAILSKVCHGTRFLISDNFLQTSYQFHFSDWNLEWTISQSWDIFNYLKFNPLNENNTNWINQSIYNIQRALSSLELQKNTLLSLKMLRRILSSAWNNSIWYFTWYQVLWIMKV